MRSSARTTVSRTRARMPSVRRSRRGRRVSAARTAVSIVGGEIVFVIGVSVIELDRAWLRAEAAPHGFVRAVGAEPFAADDTAIVHAFFGVAASGAASFVDKRHGRAREIFGSARRSVYPPAAR